MAIGTIFVVLLVKFYKSMKYLLGLAIAMSLLFTSCSSIQTNTDYDPNIDFTQYKTFSFFQKGMDSLQLNDLDKARITNAIIANLEQKGLKLSKNGDLIINVVASNKVKRDIYNSNPGGYGWGWGGMGYPNNTYVREYTEGKLYVDLVDKKRNKLVWQGFAQGIDVDNLRSKEKVLPKTIDRMFYNYPPKR